MFLSNDHRKLLLFKKNVLFDRYVPDLIKYKHSAMALFTCTLCIFIKLLYDFVFSCLYFDITNFVLEIFITYIFTLLVVFSCSYLILQILYSRLYKLYLYSTL